MVEARDDAGQVTLSLSEKFQTLIDSVAMQLGLQDEAAYLEHWARLPGGERPAAPAPSARRGLASLRGASPGSSRARSGRRDLPQARRGHRALADGARRHRPPRR